MPGSSFMPTVVMNSTSNQIQKIRNDPTRLREPGFFGRLMPPNPIDVSPPVPGVKPPGCCECGRQIEKVIEVVEKEIIKEVKVEVIKEVPKEVVKYVEVEVPVEVIREVVKTVEVPVEVIVEKEKIVEKKVNVEGARSAAARAHPPARPPPLLPDPVCHVSRAQCPFKSFGRCRWR